MNPIRTAVISAVFFILFSTQVCRADDIITLYRQVEGLNLSRQGYVLGSALTPEQKKISLANLVEERSPGTVKFKEGNLTVVAEAMTDRILVLYEAYDSLTRQELKDLIGDLFMAYDEPTVSAHDKLVYWAFGEKQRITAQAFEAAKETGKPPGILATVKLSSEARIMNAPEKAPPAPAYVVISSDPLLKAFQARNSD